MVDGNGARPWSRADARRGQAGIAMSLLVFTAESVAETKGFGSS